MSFEEKKIGLSQHSNETNNQDWKNFLLKHKWMPTSILVEKFKIQKYDLDNFRRKTAVNNILSPWHIKLTQPKERLNEIFKAAWEYYLTNVEKIDFNENPKTWVAQIISLKNISRNGSGFGFLTDSRYLEIACPEMLSEFREKGFTNIALCLFQFWPGKELLIKNGVLPFMFLQTHRRALQHLDVESMVEHIYLNFIVEEDIAFSNENLIAAKERLFARHDESSFANKADFDKFGLPYNFYKDAGGLKKVLKDLAEKYALELGYYKDDIRGWSTSEFKKLFPQRKLDQCEYCGMQPVNFTTCYREKNFRYWFLTKITLFLYAFKFMGISQENIGQMMKEKNIKNASINGSNSLRIQKK